MTHDEWVSRIQKNLPGASGALREFDGQLSSRVIARQAQRKIRILKHYHLLPVVLLLLTSTASASCFQSDLRAVCCPAACAAKKSTHWYQQADEILNGCAAAMGCERKRYLVAMYCDCRK